MRRIASRIMLLAATVVVLSLILASPALAKPTKDFKNDMEFKFNENTSCEGAKSSNFKHNGSEVSKRASAGLQSETIEASHC